MSESPSVLLVRDQDCKIDHLFPRLMPPIVQCTLYTLIRSTCTGIDSSVLYDTVPYIVSTCQVLSFKVLLHF